ncbi:MAG: hypothetical protein FD189_1285 [Elusimicrobia bacterium]|nr:MAG: hypothetical protein FD189_1285 [Elusimicrobiota bacterium]
MTKTPIKRARHKYRIWKIEYSPTREHPTDEFYFDINTAIITASKKSAQAIDVGIPCMYFPRSNQEASESAAFPRPPGLGGTTDLHSGTYNPRCPLELQR